MNNQEFTANLINALSSIPENLILTPVKDKAPRIKNWQKGVDRSTIIKEIQSGRANGIGLITGNLSGCIVAIDCDGVSAHKLAEELGGLPPTVSFTSGKEGRAQYLYLISEIYREALSKTNRKVLDTEVKGEQIEARYNASQSVLPPSVHPETGLYKWINDLTTPIAEAPAWVIELLLSEEKNKYPQQPTLDFNNPNLHKINNSPEPIPLYNCLSKDERQLIDFGVSQGGRNDGGAKIARGLIGTEKRLQYLGINYTESARGLFDNYCDRCHPPIDNKERELIWNSAEKDNPTATLPDDAIENCVKAWQRKQDPTIRNHSKSNYRTSGTGALKPQPRTESNIIEFPQQREPMSNEELEKRVTEIIDQNLSKSSTALELDQLARIANRSQKFVEDYHKKLKDELERDDDKESLKSELDELLKISNQSLDLSKYLPGNLSQVGELANRLCLRPELAVSAFYTVASSLLPVGSRIHLLDYTNFDQPLGMYTAICADPSQKKSPLINKIALEPLKALQEQACAQFEREMKNYEIEHALWSKEDNPDNPEPVQPALRRYYINNSSQAGLRNLLNQQSKQGWGLMVITDELAGSLKNQSKSYNSGMTEDFLSYYDGFGKVEALKEGFAGDFPECLVSVLGGIQPHVVKDFNNGSDNNGQWSRLNVVNQPISPFIIPDPTPAGLDIKEMLTDFYKKISQLPKLSLRLTPKATQYFAQLNNRCEENRVIAKTQALASLWGKMPGKIGRFAALIHIVEQVWANGAVVDNRIKSFTLRRAADLAKFYFDESQSLYSNCTENELAPQLAKILELAKKRQTSIAARDIKQFDRSFAKTSSDDIRGYFTQLCSLGYGQVEGSGTRLKFKIIQTVDNCRQTVDKTVDNETQSGKGLQPIVDTVDKNLKNILEHPTLLDEPKHQAVDTSTEPIIDNTPQSEGVAAASTTSTVGCNPDSAIIPPSTVLSTEASTVSKNVYSLDSNERPSQPDTLNPIDFDALKAGDILFDKKGTPHQLTERKGQMWATHKKNEYVSRHALKTGEFHHATVEDIAGLIRQTIKDGNTKQAQWLCKAYGRDGNSLMAQAIHGNLEEFSPIYALMDG